MNEGAGDFRNKSWLVWSGLIVVFLCGLLLGVVSVTTYQDNQRKHRWEKGMAGIKPRAMKHLTRELDLSVEQRQQIEPIISQAESELLRLRMAQQPRVEDVLSRTKESLKSTLKPEQQTKLDELYGRLQKRWDSDRQYVGQLGATSAQAPPDAIPSK